MAHLDPERLVLVAFGEQQFSAQEAEHLQHCETCATNTSETLTTIQVGRETHQVRDLPALSEDLWQGIAAEAFADPGDAPHGSAEPTDSGRLQRPLGMKAQRRYRNLRRSALLVAAAAIAGVAATLGTQWLAEESPHVVAEVSLASKNVAAQEAHGTATILETDNGLQMKIDVSGMPPTDGYYAVWMYDGSSTMIPIGNLGPAPLNMPASINNISSFPVIDISLQKIGEQAHGITMLQGQIDS